MNEQTNPKRTEDDQSSLERRYVTAKNIAIALFVLVFLCFKYGARVARRDIHFSVLFTRLSAALITKTSRALAAEFDGAGVDIFRCSLIDREAFRSIPSLQAAQPIEKALLWEVSRNGKVLGHLFGTYHLSSGDDRFERPMTLARAAFFEVAFPTREKRKTLSGMVAR